MSTWHYRVSPVIWEWFEELCKAKPSSIWHFRRIMRALDVRMVVMSGPEKEIGPHVRGRVVYIPRIRGKNRLLRLWLIHELAEIATAYEGIPPMTVPSNSEWDRHLVARSVEWTYSVGLQTTD